MFYENAHGTQLKNERRMPIELQREDEYDKKHSEQVKSVNKKRHR